MNKHLTITVSSAPYIDSDDCLEAAAADYVSEHPEAEGYDMDPRWKGGDDGGRTEILLDVPRPAYPRDVAELVSVLRPDLVIGDSVAVVLTQDPTLTADQVIDILEESAADYAAECGTES